jgi:hypothetical protein
MNKIKEMRERQRLAYIENNIPQKVKEGSVFMAYRWARKKLESKYGTLCIHLFKDEKNNVYYSYSKPSWASDACNSYETRNLKEAIFNALAENEAD